MPSPGTAATVDLGHGRVTIHLPQPLEHITTLLTAIARHFPDSTVHPDGLEATSDLVVDLGATFRAIPSGQVTR